MLTMLTYCSVGLELIGLARPVALFLFVLLKRCCVLCCFDFTALSCYGIVRPVQNDYTEN